jgi:GDPmannose 4,6-dehydratase
MKRALVTGITGQDGSYIAELLIINNYSVVGVVQNSDDEKMLLPSLRNKINLHQWNMLDQQGIIDALRAYKIDEIYNFAAYSSGSGMYDDPVGISEVNGIGVARILEAIRIVDKNIKLCQASSSEMFGEPTESPQSEETRFSPRSPYGAAKLYAHSMMRIYRQRYGMFACSAILYNHESPRRGLGFVTRKITHEAVKIKFGHSNELKLGNLDSRRDWGFAGDYVNAIWLMLQNSVPDDYIVATGELHSVREFCECTFKYLGLDYHNYVKVDPELARPSESVPLLGNSEKARKILGWRPSIKFNDLVKMMVDEEIKHFDGRSSK